MSERIKGMLTVDGLIIDGVDVTEALKELAAQKRPASAAEESTSTED